MAAFFIIDGTADESPPEGQARSVMLMVALAAAQCRAHLGLTGQLPTTLAVAARIVSTRVHQRGGQ